ncbi:hypothetical protein [Pseudochrobactrum sp. Wa41.01b-1]|uniref:hypothetical protein n=1 Tax=Pseudochrobactrum sp. Wa41.01b-1 TaxID=2864102 RepID=UPI00351D6AA0
MAADRRVAPWLTAGAGHAFLIQCAGDRARCDPGREFFEHAAHHDRFGLVDLAIAPDRIATGIELLDDLVAKA